MSSIRRASLAALQPTAAPRSLMTARARPARKKIASSPPLPPLPRARHPRTVTERQGGREFITMAPSAHRSWPRYRPPRGRRQLPPFNPFKLYSDYAVGAGEPAADAPQSVSVISSISPARKCRKPTGSSSAPMRSVRWSPSGRDFAYAEGTGSGQATLQLASSSPQEGFRPAAPAINTARIHKSADRRATGVPTYTPGP